MANVGTIAVKIIAEIDGLTKNVDKGNSSLEGLAKNTLTLAAAWKTFEAVFGMGAKFYGYARSFAGFMKDVADEVTPLTYVAQRVGITADQMLVFHTVAQRAGISTQTLTAKLEHFAKVLGEAQMIGSKNNKLAGLMTFGHESPSYKAMRSVGFTDEELRQPMTLYEAFEKAVGKVEQLRTGFEKVAAAELLFGRNGARALEIVNGGLDALNRQKEVNEVTGMNLSEVDAGKLQLTNDAMLKMWEMAKGLALQIYLQLAPVIIVIAEGIYDWVKGMGGMAKLTEDFAKWLAVALGIAAELGRAFLFVVMAIHALVVIIGTYLVEALLHVVDGIIMMGAALPAMISHIALNFSLLLETLSSLRDAMPAKFRDLIPFDDKMGPALKTFKGMAHDVAESSARTAKEWGKTRDSIREGSDKGRQLMKDFREGYMESLGKLGSPLKGLLDGKGFDSFTWARGIQDFFAHAQQHTQKLLEQFQKRNAFDGMLHTIDEINKALDKAAQMMDRFMEPRRKLGFLSAQHEAMRELTMDVLNPILVKKDQGLAASGALGIPGGLVDVAKAALRAGRDTDFDRASNREITDAFDKLYHDTMRPEKAFAPVGIYGTQASADIIIQSRAAQTEDMKTPMERAVTLLDALKTQEAETTARAAETAAAVRALREEFLKTQRWP